MIKKPLERTSQTYKIKLLNRTLSNSINSAKSLLKRKKLDEKERADINSKIEELINKRSLLKDSFSKRYLDSNKEAFDLLISSTNQELIQLLVDEIKLDKKQLIKDVFSSLKEVPLEFPTKKPSDNVFSFKNG